MHSPPQALGEAKQQARAQVREGDYPGALALADRLLTAFPLDDELRFLVGDILARSGLTDEAAEIWQALARHDIEIGYPLRAIVTSHALARAGRPDPTLLDQVARTYAEGSPRLAAFASRPAPLD